MVRTTRNDSPLEDKVNEAKPKEGQNSQSQDVIMNTKVEHLHKIERGAKNRELRKYLLPSSVKRISFYTAEPVSAFQYVIEINPGKTSGESAEDSGIGNTKLQQGIEGKQIRLSYPRPMDL